MSYRYTPSSNFLPDQQKVKKCRKECIDRFGDKFIPFDVNFRPGSFPGLDPNKIAKLQNLSALDACTYICYNRN
jgi:hypothetical protein